MTTPGGTLMWGQAGSYAAPDDRMVITALARGQTGLAKPLTLTAGSGLNVLLGAGWLALADCGDTTLAAIGSRVQQTVAASPGDPGAVRNDVLWADINPTTGAYSLVIIPASSVSGRLGIQLASITVPANANLASAMTLTPLPVTVGNLVRAYHVDGTTISNFTTEVDIPGATMQVPVLVPSLVFSWVTADAAINTAAGSVIGIAFNWAGSDVGSAQAPLSLGQSVGRVGISITNQVPGTIAPGTYTAKLRCSYNGAAGNGPQLRQTGLTVLVVPV